MCEFLVLADYLTQNSFSDMRGYVFLSINNTYGQLSIKVVSNRTYSTPWQIYGSQKPKMGNEWLLGYVFLERQKNPFNLIIDASFDKENKSINGSITWDISIDNINLTNCGFPKPSNGSCLERFFAHIRRFAYEKFNLWYYRWLWR